MSSNLQRAMKAAEARKRASLGEEVSGLAVGSIFDERAIFSGFDIGHEELVATANEVAFMFHQQSAALGLHHLFFAAWVDGLLTGLLAASLPPAESGARTPLDSEERH